MHMAQPKFQIFIGANNQYYFRLRAGNSEIVLSSEGYTSKQGCTNGIESVRKNSPDDRNYERKDKTMNYSFNLKAGNGEVIGRSESYTTAQNREAGIQVVMRIAPTAIIEELE